MGLGVLISSSATTLLLDKRPKQESPFSIGLLSGLPKPSEALRKKLLEEELKLRAKQPPHWAKTKYRKYAMMGMSPSEAELFNSRAAKPRKKKKRKLGLPKIGKKKKIAKRKKR